MANTTQQQTQPTYRYGQLWDTPYGRMRVAQVVSGGAWLEIEEPSERARILGLGRGKRMPSAFLGQDCRLISAEERLAAAGAR